MRGHVTHKDALLDRQLLPGHSFRAAAVSRRSRPLVGPCCSTSRAGSEDLSGSLATYYHEMQCPNNRPFSKAMQVRAYG